MNFAEFENKWVSKLQDEFLKSFPESFIDNNEFEIVSLPGKPLLKGTELFGNYEIIDTDGNTLLSTDDLNKVKYLLYANRELPTKVKVVTDKTALTTSVKNYENHLDEIVKIINVDFKKLYPASDKFIAVTNKIFQLLNLYRY